MRRRRRARPLIVAVLCAGWLGHACAGAVVVEAASDASSARASRWWKLTCNDEPAPCTLTVRLRGVIDPSRLRIVEEAVRRRERTQQARGRPVALRVDIDSSGGQVFVALQIGRLLRHEGAAARLGRGASCVSACVFVLMGAAPREVAAGARIGLHSPSLGDARRDALVPAMSDQLAQYAEEMGVSPRIVDEMLAIPASRMRYVTRGELERYGLSVTTTR